MIIPFTGFPYGWKLALYVLFGAIILVLSLLIRRELHEVLRTLHGSHAVKNDTFSETKPQAEQK